MMIIVRSTLRCTRKEHTRGSRKRVHEKLTHVSIKMNSRDHAIERIKSKPQEHDIRVDGSTLVLVAAQERTHGLERRDG